MKILKICYIMRRETEREKELRLGTLLFDHNNGLHSKSFGCRSSGPQALGHAPLPLFSALYSMPCTPSPLSFCLPPCPFFFNITRWLWIFVLCSTLLLYYIMGGILWLEIQAADTDTITARAIQQEQLAWRPEHCQGASGNKYAAEHRQKGCLSSV